MDEFGNPLPDVINPDTATYDLDTGANPDELRCPRNWVEFQESCYKFNRSPPKRWDLAREICQVSNNRFFCTPVLYCNLPELQTRRQRQGRPGEHQQL